MNKDEKLLLQKYGITISGAPDMSFVEQFGIYKYRKFKTKLFPSTTIKFEHIENLIRFDLQMSRILYKYIRPLERNMKRYINASLSKFFKTINLKNNLQDLHDYLYQWETEIRKSSLNKDKIRKSLKTINLIREKINKNFNSKKTIRRFIDEMDLGLTTDWLNAYARYDVKLSNLKNVISNGVPIRLLADIRNSVMHFNIGFNNKKLKNNNYKGIITKFVELGKAIMEDIHGSGDIFEDSLNNDVVKILKKKFANDILLLEDMLTVDVYGNVKNQMGGV